MPLMRLATYVGSVLALSAIAATLLAESRRITDWGVIQLVGIERTRFVNLTLTLPAHEQGANDAFEGISLSQARLEGSIAMDGKTSALLKDSERETPSRVGTPRLLNAAAWLETLAALEEEFKSILAEKTASTRQTANKRDS